jgi:hypothetical protein
MYYGIIAPDDTGGGPGKAGTVTSIENSTFANAINIRVPTGKYRPLRIPGKTLEIIDSYFRSVNTEGMIVPLTTQYDIAMWYLPPSEYSARDLMGLDEVRIENFNGVASDDFNVYYLEQRPTFAPPPSMDGTGSPQPWLTNEQLWTSYGVAVGGAVAPCVETRANIYGYACAEGLSKSPVAAAPEPNEPPVQVDLDALDFLFALLDARSG